MLGASGHVTVKPFIRDLGGVVGVRSCNSTLKEIAEHLGLHYATMSRAIKWVTLFLPR
jgi:hypothetical protein